jgi:membrane fusion protein, multidrug efflux system
MASVIRWTCGLLLLGCAAVAVGAWQLHARDAMIAWDPDQARSHAKPIPVRTVKAEQRDISETIGGTAVTMPAQTATLNIPLNASAVSDRQVRQVNCWAGSVVHRGDVLVTFEPALFEQTVRQRTALVGKTQQELLAYQKLYQQKAASAMQVKEAEVAVETAQLELALAMQDLQLCTITSPISGVVDEINVVPEQRVSGGATVAVIHQLDPIFVQMDYPMERIDSLSVGQTAEVTLDAFPQEAFEGKVIRIAPIVSTKTRVLPVIIEVPNPDNRIRAGISGFVRIKSSRSGATTVPSVAVIKKQQKAMVFTVEDNRAKIREVRTGNITDAGQVEILDGLASGEEVVIFGHDAIQENDLVNVDWRAWTRRDSSAP